MVAMLANIKRFLENLSPDQSCSEENQQHALQLAVCVLLVEMARVDGKMSEQEFQRLTDIIDKQFSLTDDEKQELTELAHHELNEATDYYQFTAVLNQHFNAQEKLKVIEYLWEVAYVDGKIDAHEEHYLRKIHSLLHISHSQFIRVKHEVVERQDDSN
jgi:uncharacterized tellurite resistance protein B-like protein